MATVTASPVLAVLVCLVLASICRATAIEAHGRVGDRLAPTDFDAERLLIVHYHRPDGVYGNWNVWAWPEGEDGAAHELTGATSFGRYAVVPFQGPVDRVGFVIRHGNWETKDGDVDRFVNLDDAVTEIWLVAGEPRIHAGPDEADLSLRVLGAFLDAPDHVTVTTTAPLHHPLKQGIGVLLDGAPSAYRATDVAMSDQVGRGQVYNLSVDPPVSPEHVARLSLALPEVGTHTVFARDVLNAGAFVALDAELGPRYTPAQTTFRAWSPVSTDVSVLLFASLDAAEPREAIAMENRGRGVWEAIVPGDLDGRAYVLRYRNYGRERVVPDIYATAATADSRRSVVIDLDRTDPDGWGSTPAPAVDRMTDEVLYEIHVRDYSILDRECTAEHRGTYLGLAHDAPGRGLDHFRKLGVTAVHLLPVQAYGGDRHAYNWGYWTALFNVAESGYATDPADPASAPRDLKLAIHRLHGAGIRVILDVVYNHTATGRYAAAFEAAAPYYYFRTTAGGQRRNDAGTGNSIADERPMVRKYIIDSLTHWVREYGVDGFRFDLLGTHHPETVWAILEALEAVRPDLTVYGEPWTGGGPLYFAKGAQRGRGMGVFNDHLRNAVRGDLDGDKPGFATGPGGDVGKVLSGLFGAIDDFAQKPSESINYVSAHDNRTLWDKLAVTAPDATDQTRRRMQKLALGIVLTSQGVPFLHGGSEFCRTKGGNHNSYNAGDAVNAFDWERKDEYRDVFDYIAGIVALRRAHPAFRLPDSAPVRAHVRALETGPLIALALDGGAVGDPWGTVLIAYNGEPESSTWRLPDGRWTQVVDAERAGVDTLGEFEGEVELPPYSMAVWHD